MSFTPKGLKIPGAENSLYPGALAPETLVPNTADAAPIVPDRLRYDASPEFVTAGSGMRRGDAVVDVQIKTFRPIHVARVRHVGPYEEVGCGFERLFKWAAHIDAPTGRVLTLSWDDPGNVAPARLRFDACVELHTHETPPPGIALGPVGEGRFAVYRLSGPYEGIAPAYRKLLGEWLPESGESRDDRPCMELYRKSTMDTAPENLSTDLCVPLRAAAAGG